MAKTKAELEAEHAAYHEAVVLARTALQEGRYTNAIELAISSLGYVDGMMQYDRKYEDGEAGGIEAINIILDYAPLFFHFQSLDTLSSLLKNQRRITRNASDDLDEKLTQAKALMWAAHRMWDYLEFHSPVRQDQIGKALGGDQHQWRLLAETWQRMGLLLSIPERGSYRLSLTTRMGEIVAAKCSSCGSKAEAPKAMFLERLTCRACRSKTMFVILAKSAEAKEE